MDAQLRLQLQQTIYVATASSRNNFGDPVYGVPTAVKARVETDTQEMETPDAEKRQTRWVIITESQINMSDRIWLPGVDQTNSALGREPRQVDQLVDELGVVDHFETTV